MSVYFLASVVQVVSEIVIIKLMVDIERHCDWATVRVQSVVQNRRVVGDGRLCNSSIE
jgi:hypothetical protein